MIDFTRIKKKKGVMISILSAVIAMTSVAVPTNVTIAGTYYADGVTKEMSNPNYWINKTGVISDMELMNNDEIINMNNRALTTEGTNLNNLENMNPTYNALSLRNSLSSMSPEDDDYYINGSIIDKNEYYNKMNQSVRETGYGEEERQIQYAVSTKIADVKLCPSDDIVGFFSDDPDDEITNSAMSVNEPFVIMQKCDIDGKTFYYGYTLNCEGWVNADVLAICNSKEEWLSSWKCEVGSKDFVVVTESKIYMEKSISTPATSELKLNLGTKLKLVPENDIPENIAERGTWNNYVVYIPTRDSEGRYVRQVGLISEHHNVSVGYMELNQKNILDVAFSCLGDRYGWGNMLGAFDCSGYTRNVYSVFGLNIPRDSRPQTNAPTTVKDLTDINIDEKMEILKTLPAGTELFFKGHIMLFTGIVDGVPYAINALGAASESTGEVMVKDINTIVITPLTVRRRSGNTWLEDITKAVVYTDESKLGSALTMGWKNIKGTIYWYEEGIRQGYRTNQDGTIDMSYRGKEIYDPESDAWYWLDNVDAGKKAVSKDVYMESLAGQWGEIKVYNSDGTENVGANTGKWVRYDENGHMIKGWHTNENGTYYFDLIYGTMAKGTTVIDGVEYTFDTITGILK